jgi:hypothetical protein
MELVVLASPPPWYRIGLVVLEPSTKRIFPVSVGSLEETDLLDLQPYDTIVAYRSPAGEVPDPARPDLISIERPARRRKPARRSKTARLLEDLVSSRDEPLLGFFGPSSRYWTFQADKPSVAIAPVGKDVVVYKTESNALPWVGFQRGRFEEHLPLLDQRVALALESIVPDDNNPAAVGNGGRILTISELKKSLGFIPRYLVAVLAPPKDGRCQKMAVGLLAGR